MTLQQEQTPAPTAAVVGDPRRPRTAIRGHRRQRAVVADLASWRRAAGSGR